MKTSKILAAGDGTKLAYHHYQNGHDRLVVLVHGFYNSKDSSELQHLKECLSDDYDVFTVDLRGHGKSGGRFSWTSKEPQDLLMLVAPLAGQYEQVGVVGFSLGASVCLNALAQEPFADSAVMVSAVSDVAKVDYRFWELDLKKDFFYTLMSRTDRRGKGVRVGEFWLKKIKPVEAVKKIKLPVLYIHGDNDWVIKPTHSRALFKNTAAVKKELIIVKDGSHAEYLVRDYPEAMTGYIKTWFSRTFNDKGVKP